MNALARQMVEVVVLDRSLPLDVNHVDEAKEILRQTVQEANAPRAIKVFWAAIDKPLVLVIFIPW